MAGNQNRAAAPRTKKIIFVLLLSIVCTLALPIVVQAEDPITAIVNTALNRGLYELYRLMALIFWQLNKLFLLVALLLGVFRAWLISPDGIPALIGVVISQVQFLWPLVATVAVLIFGLGLGLSWLWPNFRLVDLRRALAYTALAGLLMAQGADIVSGLESLRAGLAGVVTTGVGQLIGNMSGMLDGWSIVGSGELYGDTPELDGSPGAGAAELAASYLFVDSREDMARITLPVQFQETFFAHNNFGGLSSAQQTAALESAKNGLLRLLQVPSVGIFAINEQYVYLILTLSALLILSGIPLALTFAFFTYTEGIIISLLQAYLRLFIKTAVISVLMALVTGTMLASGSAGSIPVTFAMSVISTLVAWQMRTIAKESLGEAFRSLSGAMRPVLGGPDIATEVNKFRQKAGDIAGTAAGLGLIAVTGGAGAPVAGAVGSAVSGAVGGEKSLLPGFGRMIGGAMLGRSGQAGRMASGAAALGLFDGQGAWDTLVEELREGDPNRQVQLGVAMGGRSDFGLGYMAMQLGRQRKNRQPPPSPPPPQEEAHINDNIGNPAFVRSWVEAWRKNPADKPRLEQIAAYALGQQGPKFGAVVDDAPEAARVLRAVEYTVRDQQKKGGQEGVLAHFLDEQGELRPAAVADIQNKAVGLGADAATAARHIEEIVRAGLNIRRTVDITAIAEAVASAVEHKKDAAFMSNSLSLPSQSLGGYYSAVNGLINDALQGGISGPQVQRLILEIKGEGISPALEKELRRTLQSDTAWQRLSNNAAAVPSQIEGAI